MPILRKLPYFTQPQAFYAIEAVLSAYGSKPSSNLVHVAATVLGWVNQAGNGRISNGTLAASVLTSERSLKRVLRLMIDAGLIKQSFGDGPGKMATFTLGENAQGEAWEQAWEVGSKRFAWQIGINCKESKCGDDASFTPRSHRLTLSPKPTFNPEAEKGLSGLISEPGPAAEKGQPGLISPEKGTSQAKKGLVGPGTDRAFDLAELNTEPDPVFSSGFTAARLFNQPPQGEGDSPSLLDDLRREYQSESSKEERSSQDDAELIDQPGPERPTASQAQVQNATTDDEHLLIEPAEVNLINGAANPLNVTEGDHVVFKGQLCVVMPCGWDWYANEYTLQCVESKKTHRAPDYQVSLPHPLAIIDKAA